MAEKSKAGRDIVALHHPDDLAHDLDHDKLSHGLAENMIAAVNKERAKQGLPPLPKG